MSTPEDIAFDAALDEAVAAIEADQREHVRTCPGCDTCRPITIFDML